MIPHVVLLTFVPEATPEQRAAVAHGLRALPPLVITDHIAPIRVGRAAIQFER